MALGANILCFGLSIAFVSRLTSSMTQLHMLSSSRTQQHATLRQYLNKNNISDRLCWRIQRNVQEALLLQQSSISEASVEMLTIISEPLRMELHFEIFAPSLEHHAFFGKYIEAYPHVMQKICHQGIASVDVFEGDVIFHYGEAPEYPRMYTLNAGSLVYNNQDNVSTDLHGGAFISEAVIWSKWIHRGELLCKTKCNMLCFDSTIFAQLAGQTVLSEDYPDADPRAYAAKFIQALNERGQDADDLFTLKTLDADDHEVHPLSPVEARLSEEVVRLKKSTYSLERGLRSLFSAIVGRKVS
eukprot:TRINITY_DN20993_c3_g1_i1.p1 TRINITY_DN20993_c3_g1~~TRINITY_DN20993_c3_g1_i1.p1  ORF type:complete len:316 (+),score=41.46 TRINITY_DN20993_c3_g1_i1:50-949(+)